MTLKWTTPSTAVSGGDITDELWNQQVRDNMEAVNGFVRKTADESVTSSTTLQDDNELAFSIPQAGTYVFEVLIFATSAANAAGDLAVGFSFPTGTCHFGMTGLDSSLASGGTGTFTGRAQHTATSGTSNLPLGLSSLINFYRVTGILVATASGTLQMKWAQESSNANASTIKAGSYMTLRQVA